MEGRRRSIRRRMQRIVISVSAAALILTSIVGGVTMFRIRDRAEDALTGQMTQNLADIVRSKALLADAEFGVYADQTTLFAEYLHELYENPDRYLPREVAPTSAENAGIFIMQQTLADESVSGDSVREEAELLTSIEDVFHPIISEPGSDIAVIYFGTVSGQILCYDNQSDIKPVGTNYNFYDTAWYQLGDAERRTCFTNVYLDSFGRGLTITCVAPFYGADGAFAGVVGSDILITSVYEEIVRLDLAEGAYAFLVDGEGNVISPDGSERTIADDADLDEASAARLLSGEGAVLLTKSGVYYASAPVASVGWTLCIHIPQSLALETVGQMERNIRNSIWICLGLFLVILGSVLLAAGRFSRNMTEPLTRLGEDVRKISGGNLEYRARAQDYDEIGDLAGTFNDMAGSLKTYIESLTSVTAERERIGAELAVATRIQADMLPKSFPERAEFELGASMAPAKEMCGDFYDFFLTDDDHLALIVADVAGKGVPAAIFMASAKTLLKARVLQGGTPGKILADVNDRLCDGNEEELFVTVWLGIYSIRTGTLVSASAGHEYPAIRHSGEAYALMTGENDPPLAAMPGLSFGEAETALRSGDSLFLYTDGIPDAKNAAGERYGQGRMMDALTRYADSGAEDLLSLVKADIDGFAGSEEAFDDITMMVLKIR